MGNNTTQLKSWELPDELWNNFKALIPPKKSQMGRPIEVDFKQILSGIFYVLRTGIHWQACPREQFGPPSTVHYYFSQWSQMGIFEQIWAEVLKIYDDLKGIEWEWQSIDGAMTKAPLGGEETGANPTDRGKLGTKRSLHTDGKGIPIGIVPSGANRHDMKLLAFTLGATVVERPEPTEDHPQHLCLDKGYDYEQCHQEANQQNYIPHIRARGEEIQDKRNTPGYKPRRWVVEVTHSWLNRFRKILIRFEKKVVNHFGLIQFACAYITYKKVETY